MKNLFVGNMSFQTTESDLTALFQAYGQVTRVHVATDRDTGRARGFAFVEMPNDEEAAKAVADLNGKEVGGRALKVNEARPKGTAPQRAAVTAAGTSKADSLTKIIENPLASRASPAGSPHRGGGEIDTLHSDSKETPWALPT